MIGFLVGLFVGTPVGFLLCAMFAAGRRADERATRVLGYRQVVFPDHPRRSA